ncbi:hypothetical protein JOC86_003594 [Bacillus pakistanensis]|uniref:DoxX-like family protein n=1 Tax=Rossellomorea pakistanensis TaxID=992288 RepID=A0ABS2NGP9_9BACI|nr:DoxX-like family protein [Bacillus pakistanensis]MBM7587042.1 hypothetical protein [Bacillus pakistanensis]
MKNKPIYVEIPIKAEMERLWEVTQTPTLHEQWDLRFSSITYLPKKADEPQLFTYKTKIGFGLAVEGWGKSVGSHQTKDNTRTSSLHFGTDQKLSIIREGKGYWQYKTRQGSIDFLTQYDYEVNFGRIGVVFDKLFFRPLIGWATALSFDVLKRWLEKGEAPHLQYKRFFSTWLISFLFFFIWSYHGLFPKIFAQHPEEIALAGSLISMTANQVTSFVIGVGILEVLFGLMWLFYPYKRKLLGIQIVIFPLLTIAAIIADPGSLTHPFSPLTFNMALTILSIIGFYFSNDVPTSSSCKRRRT